MRSALEILESWSPKSGDFGLHSLPLGCAGMFTQMAEQIAGANFVLPAEIPYYGPGGIPFVYPPLGHYLFALYLKTGLSPWAYLRRFLAVLSFPGFILLSFRRQFHLSLAFLLTLTMGEGILLPHQPGGDGCLSKNYSPRSTLNRRSSISAR